MSTNLVISHLYSMLSVQIAVDIHFAATVMWRVACGVAQESLAIAKPCLVCSRFGRATRRYRSPQTFHLHRSSNDMQRRLHAATAALGGSAPWTRCARPVTQYRITGLVCRSCRKNFSTSQIFKQASRTAVKAVEKDRSGNLGILPPHKC